jgi:hypothetical protein
MMSLLNSALSQELYKILYNNLPGILYKFRIVVICILLIRGGERLDGRRNWIKDVPCSFSVQRQKPNPIDFI